MKRTTKTQMRHAIRLYRRRIAYRLKSSKRLKRTRKAPIREVLNCACEITGQYWRRTGQAPLIDDVLDYIEEHIA